MWQIGDGNSFFSLPCLCFFEIPKEEMKTLDYYLSRFLWHYDKHNKSIGSLSGAYSINQSGLGILNLKVQNSLLLSKWLSKLLNKDRLWQEVLKKKYLKENCLPQVIEQPRDSHFLLGLMNVRDILLKHGSFKVTNEIGTSFWEDYWICQKPLKQLCPPLYKIVRRKVLSTTRLKILFRRMLVSERMNEWLKLVSVVVWLYPFACECKRPEYFSILNLKR